MRNVLQIVRLRKCTSFVVIQFSVEPRNCHSREVATTGSLLRLRGVAGLTKTLAAEWGVRGVRVNAILPGYFMTPLAESNMSPLRKQQALDRTPMDRFGKLEEICSAAFFLASPASTFINGTIVNVDGGYLHAGIK